MVLDIIYTFTIVITGFTAYILILVFIPSNLFNAISQALVLILLLIYLSCGIDKLLGYWKMLIIY